MAITRTKEKEKPVTLFHRTPACVSILIERDGFSEKKPDLHPEVKKVYAEYGNAFTRITSVVRRAAEELVEREMPGDLKKCRQRGTFFALEHDQSFMMGHGRHVLRVDLLPKRGTAFVFDAELFTALMHTLKEPVEGAFKGNKLAGKDPDEDTKSFLGLLKNSDAACGLAAAYARSMLPLNDFLSNYRRTADGSWARKRGASGSGPPEFTLPEVLIIQPPKILGISHEEYRGLD